MSATADNDAGAVLKAADIEKDAAGTVKRWCAELDLADTAEKDWRTEGKDIWQRYEADVGATSSSEDDFNILWSNTETLAPAVYNSRPEPDVRRRFRDADNVARFASQVLERALTYTIDTDEFDEVIKDAVLDALLPGRGVVRIKYEPKFATVGAPADADDSEPAPAAAGQLTPAPLPEGAGPATAGAGEDAAHQAQQYEVIADEAAPVEHVQWDDFRHGPGKRWADVWWIAFRHRMSFDELTESFGESVATLVPMDATGYEGTDSQPNDESLKPYFKKADVWEVWDKQRQRVLFICRTYKAKPLKELTDPLELQDFFPLPRPLEALRNSRSLIPTPMFRLYKKRAAELDKLTGRIKKLTDALKVRGAYDNRLEEAKGILDSGDGEMVPIKNASAVAAMGGLEKALWIAPIDHIIEALNGLYEAREQCKQTIYEITGISDIVRGSTVASETATAQSLKSKWGTIRLQRLQSEVQRFVKDLLRLMADLIARRFTQATLAKMTGVQLPMQADKDQLQMKIVQMGAQYGAQHQQWQQASQQAQASGQPPPQEPPPPQPDPKDMETLAMPSWEDVMQLLQSDGLRTCRVDVETDSTVQAMQDQDLQGITQIMGLIGQLIQGAVPAVQGGMMTAENIRDMAVSIARKARMGAVFEDVLEQMQPPTPQAPQAPPGGDQMAQAVGQIHGMVADLHSHVTGAPPHQLPPQTSTPQLPASTPQGVQ